MKLLLIYCDDFSYSPADKVLEHFPDITDDLSLTAVQTAFIHAEAADMEKGPELEKKLLKNIKWAAGKNETKKVVLHSFAHLSESKAAPEFTKALFDRIEERLENAGYKVWQTPFGYFLDLRINAPGYSMARVFKSI